jgi:uncharacterized damage-inducible protein DinB
MAQGQQETREEEVARVRGYLVSQSTRRTPAQLVEALREAHGQFLAAIAAIPDAYFRTAPREGEWSGADVLLHMRRIAAIEATVVPTLIEGKTPDTHSEPPGSTQATREESLADLNRSRERLAEVVLQADPQTPLEATRSHPEFGPMNWREWVLFARVHALDHTRQLQAIKVALIQQQEAREHEAGR